MAKFERSRERKSKDSKFSPPKREFRENRGDRTFESFKGRDRKDSGRESNRFGRDRRDVEMTRVICSSCGTRCEVPFKPTSSKPVYCSDCFVKKEKASSDKFSDKDFDIINEKLNKIMRALDIK
ncbi:MAG: hypothetical protein KKA58_05860 [Nanoarchaeota archaeon]|nr:hypothetical protein [Nanoarchaeota archaeon]